MTIFASEGDTVTLSLSLSLPHGIYQNDSRAVKFTIRMNKGRASIASNWKVYRFDWKGNKNIEENFGNATRNLLVNRYLVEGAEQLAKLCRKLKKGNQLSLENLAKEFREWLYSQEVIFY